MLSRELAALRRTAAEVARTRRSSCAVARSLQEAAAAPRTVDAAAVTELDLSGSGSQPHGDLVCVNMMCEHVGGVCICRLSRVLERSSLAQLETLRLGGNGLSALPPSVWRLQKLKLLDLKDNRFAAVPPEAATLPGLRVELGESSLGAKE